VVPQKFHPNLETLRARGTAAADLERGELGVALDFVHDAVDCGRTIRVLSVVDAYTRECLAFEVDTSLASRRVTPGAPGSRRGVGR